MGTKDMKQEGKEQFKGVESVPAEPLTLLSLTSLIDAFTFPYAKRTDEKDTYHRVLAELITEINRQGYTVLLRGGMALSEINPVYPDPRYETAIRVFYPDLYKFNSTVEETGKKFRASLNPQNSLDSASCDQLRIRYAQLAKALSLCRTYLQGIMEAADLDFKTNMPVDRIQQLFGNINAQSGRADLIKGGVFHPANNPNTASGFRLVMETEDEEYASCHFMPIDMAGDSRGGTKSTNFDRVRYLSADTDVLGYPEIVFASLNDTLPQWTERNGKKHPIFIYPLRSELEQLATGRLSMMAMRGARQIAETDAIPVNQDTVHKVLQQRADLADISLSQPQKYYMALDALSGMIFCPAFIYVTMLPNEIVKSLPDEIRKHPLLAGKQVRGFDIGRTSAGKANPLFQINTQDATGIVSALLEIGSSEVAAFEKFRLTVKTLWSYYGNHSDGNCVNGEELPDLYKMILMLGNNTTQNGIDEYSVRFDRYIK